MDLKMRYKMVWSCSIALMVFVLVACGSATQDNNGQETMSETGAVSFRVIFQKDSESIPDRQSSSLSSCQDIQQVAVSVYDLTGAQLREGEWPCSDHRGTLDGISKGIRILLIQGILLEGEHRTILYEGRAENIQIEAGKTTEVGTIIARFLETTPEVLADQDGDVYTPQMGDCDDHNSAIHPGAAETCNGIDDNCNGQIDEGVLTTFYRDADGDGHGTPNQTISACAQPSGYVSNSDDCNDANAAVHPGASEVQCDAIDNDCSGGDYCPRPPNTYYRDADADGYGNPMLPITSTAPVAPAGYVADNTDCNDSNSAVRPGVTELCNGIDDNCNGQIDEGVLSTFYRDADGDGHGTANQTMLACAQPSGYVRSSDDCNDIIASIYPGATEQCNGLDDNCNGNIDEDVRMTYYRDSDGDTYGNAADSILSCTQPNGFVSRAGDCNDSDPNVNPDVHESCNNRDDNCDGRTDEGAQLTFYRDADGDTFGNAAVTTLACTAPAGYVSNSSDCDDTSAAAAAVHPGATEICNGIDDNCNGQIDEGVQITYYRDADGDGYGNPDPALTTQACSMPAGYAANNADCNDSPSSGASIHPGAVEICGDGIDQDCNGSDLPCITPVVNYLLWF